MPPPDTTAEFNALADEWQKHCQSVMFSSNIRDYLNHPSYKKLIELGRPAVPLIMARYKTDSLPWGFVLQEITGETMIPDPNKFSPADVKKRWFEWWEKQKK
jgi:hypothetical protein